MDRCLQDAVAHPLDKEYEFLRILIPTDCQNVAIVALNRPRKRNAIHGILFKEIGSVFSRLGRIGDDTRAVLLVGFGSSFCAGIDLTDNSLVAFSNDEEGDIARTGMASVLPIVRDMQACFTALEQCPLPVVAAIHGNCIGVGVDLICCADIRLCADSAVFSVREVAVGLAADVGTLQRLPKIVGNQSIVRELCLTARNVSAVEAANIGFVSKCVAHDEELFASALQLCQQIVQHSPVAVQATKQALVYARDHTVADGLEQIALTNAVALQGDDLGLAFSSRNTRSNIDFPKMPVHSRL